MSRRACPPGSATSGPGGGPLLGVEPALGGRSSGVSRRPSPPLGRPAMPSVLPPRRQPDRRASATARERRPDRGPMPRAGQTGRLPSLRDAARRPPRPASRLSQGWPKPPSAAGYRAFRDEPARRSAVRQCRACCRRGDSRIAERPRPRASAGPIEALCHAPGSSAGFLPLRGAHSRPGSRQATARERRPDRGLCHAPGRPAGFLLCAPPLAGRLAPAVKLATAAEGSRIAHPPRSSRFPLTSPVAPKRGRGRQCGRAGCRCGAAGRRASATARERRPDRGPMPRAGQLGRLPSLRAARSRPARARRQGSGRSRAVCDARRAPASSASVMSRPRSPARVRDERAARRAAAWGRTPDHRPRRGERQPR